jgi:hypothetical protein
MTKKPCDERPDLEKCQSQWWELTGLHDREESSAAIVRAATAAEIACNFAIRTEFAKQGNLRADVVDKLLHDVQSGYQDALNYERPDDFHYQGLFRIVQELASIHCPTRVKVLGAGFNHPNGHE